MLTNDPNVHSFGFFTVFKETILNEYTLELNAKEEKKQMDPSRFSDRGESLK